MKTSAEIIKAIKKASSPEGIKGQAYFGISGINNYGLRVPQMRAMAKTIGMNHKLAMELWETGIHEARHIAVFIADKKLVSVELMEHWIKDFNSWDIVDNCCSTLFSKSPLAYDKAKEWSRREPEFEKRAGFSLMAYLAVHDKKADDSSFEKFFPFLIAESNDNRNFVRKAVNWAIRQIGKRNERLCKKAIKLSEEIYKKDDPASKWIATDALRELRLYLKDGKIGNVGKK